MKDKFLESPWALGLIGGAVGAIAGKVLGGKAKERYGHSDQQFGYAGSERPYDEFNATHAPGYGAGYAAGGYAEGDDSNYGSGAYGYAGYQQSEIITEDPMYGLDTGESGDRMQGIRDSASQKAEGVKARASDLKHMAEDKAGDLKHRAEDRASDLKHRASDRAEQLKHRAGSMRHRAGERLSHAIPSKEGIRRQAHRAHGTLESRPELWGIAAVVAGAVFGALMPVTGRERKVLGPVKSDAQHRIMAAKDEVVDRAKSFTHGLHDELRSESSEEGEGFAGQRGQRPEGAEQTSLAGPDSYGAAGSYGATSGFDSGGQESPRTYTAGSSDENREGFHPVPDPDVTRH